MASVESEFQPQEPYTPDTSSGGCLSGSTESPQANSVAVHFPSKIGSNLVPSPSNVQPTCEDWAEIGSPASSISWEESEEQDNPHNWRGKSRLTESKNDIQLQSGWRTVGRADVNWRSDLSQNAQKLYQLLLHEMGDTDLLPEFAAEYEFSLHEALDELRSLHLVDERDPDRVRLL